MRRLTLQLVPGLSGLGQAIGRWGLKFDMKYAREIRLAVLSLLDEYITLA